MSKPVKPGVFGQQSQITLPRQDRRFCSPPPLGCGFSSFLVLRTHADIERKMFWVTGGRSRGSSAEVRGSSGRPDPLLTHFSRILFFPSLPHFVSFVRLLAAVMGRCISTCTLWRHELHLKYSRVECVYIPIFQSFYVYSSLKVYAFLTVPAFLRATVAVADDWDLNGGWHCTHVVSCHLCTTGPCTDTFFFFLQDSVLLFSKVYRQLTMLHLWLSGNGNCYGLVQEERWIICVIQGTNSHFTGRRRTLWAVLAGPHNFIGLLRG